MIGWANERQAYRLGVGVAIAASFLTIWTTIVRDDGNGIGPFMLVMAAAVGSVSAGFRSAGMARTMLGIAVMQASLGGLLATAPSIANTPHGALNILLSSGFFIALWLIAAALFRAAAKTAPGTIHR
jgi:hypothetical protein